jgi:hypothetical protein
MNKQLWPVFLVLSDWKAGSIQKRTNSIALRVG